MAQSRKLQAMCVRTKMCKYFLAGSCREGGSCVFAHCTEELQAAPDLRRTKLCPTLIETGCCINGACTFAHGRDQLRRIQLVLQPSRGPGHQSQHRHGQPQPPADREPMESAVQGAAYRSSTAADTPAQERLHGGVRESGKGDQDVPWCTQPGRPGSNTSTPSEISEWDSDTPPMSRDGLSGFGPDRPVSPAAGSQLLGQAGSGQRPLRNKFHKTKLCQLFFSGCCRKRTCSFAHSREELAALPDLRCTKMCLAVQSGGVCADGACRFAHTSAELRTPAFSPEMPSLAPVGMPASRAGSRTSPGSVEKFALELAEALQVVKAAGFDVRPTAQAVPQLGGAMQPSPKRPQPARRAAGPKPQASLPAGVKGDSVRAAATQAERFGRREPFRVVVKNTFLHIPEATDSETPKVLRRTCSATF